jgi:hypothetical protein
VSESASSDILSIVARFATDAIAPPDLTLAALERAVLACPGEDTPVFLYIDRCRELGLDALANLVEADLKLKRHRREMAEKAKAEASNYGKMYDEMLQHIVRAFGLSAHLVNPPALARPDDGKTPWPIAPPPGTST